MSRWINHVVWIIVASLVLISVQPGFAAPQPASSANKAPAARDLALPLTCSTDPSTIQLATSCYQFGPSATNTDPAVVAFAYNASGTSPAPVDLANTNQVGATFGLAYQQSSKSLFAAAYMKRHAAFGPGGTGMIYRIDTVTHAVTNFLDLGGGADPHPAGAVFLAWFHDSNSFDPVGKISLGGLAFDETNAILYAVNLANRSLYRIPVGNPPTPPAAGAISSFPVPTTGRCSSAADIRPFGLGIDLSGTVYLGEVCSAQSSGVATDLRAFVYTFNPTTNLFSAAPVLDFPLNYPRTCADQSGIGCPDPAVKAAWRPWIGTFAQAQFKADRYGANPQPMLTSITFDGPDMVLGIRDRFGDQVGRNAGNTDPADPAQYNSLPAGDTLRACSNGAGGFVLESNAACGMRTTAGAGNGQGPGGGEFYFSDNVPGFHDEISLGGLATIPGLSDVVSTVYDPNDVLFTGGARWWNKDNGARVRGYQLYSAVSPGTFGKANGLGSIAVLCEAPQAAAPAVAQAQPTEVPTPRLEMTKEVSQQLVQPGDSLTFTIRVRNTGNAPADNNVVVDTVPDPLIVTGAGTSQGTASRAGNMVTLTIGTINPGQTITLTIDARVPTNVQTPQDLTNTAYLLKLSASTTLRITRPNLPGTGEPPDLSRVIQIGLGLSLLAAFGAMWWARRRGGGEVR